MCPFFPSTGGLCKIITLLKKNSIVGSKNAPNPWEMKRLEVKCGLFVAGPHPDIFGFPLDSLLASVSLLFSLLSFS